MKKDEHKNFKKDLEKFNLNKSDRLKLENEELKKELESVKKEFNDYKILMQCEVIPERDLRLSEIKQILRINEDVQARNDALINFILESDLREKFYNDFIESYYPYDVFDFRDKNEVNFSEISINENNNKDLIGAISYNLKLNASQN